jgi:hypothetical protein
MGIDHNYQILFPSARRKRRIEHTLSNQKTQTHFFPVLQQLETHCQRLLSSTEAMTQPN